MPGRRTIALAAALALAPPAVAAPLPSEVARFAANKATAIAFWTAINERGWDAGTRYLAPGYHEHGGGDPAGLAALRDHYNGLKRTSPAHYSVVVRSVAQGDLVYLQIHDFAAPGDFGTAITCYLRFEDGRIAEQWTAKQPVPGIRNFNGMF